MRRGFSPSSFKADLHRQMYPEQYAAAREAAQRIATAIIDASTLPIPQQATLLLMHESHVKRALYGRLIEDAHDKPRASDFHDLARLNLARYAAGKRLHELTGDGVIAAKALERKLCQQFGIHVMSGFDRTTTSSGDTSRHCCCGQWRWAGRAGDFTEANARRSFNRHVASVQGVSKLRAALEPLRMMEG